MEVLNNDRGPLDCFELHLEKGKNSIPADLWEKYRSHPFIAKRLRGGRLIELSAPPVEAPPAPPKRGRPKKTE